MASACRIAVVYTGGTIGMAPNANGRLVPLALAELEQSLLALAVGYDITLLPVSYDGEALAPIDSSEVDDGFWRALTTTLQSVLSEFDAVIVLHGTDTMAYSVAAIGFALGSLAKKVIFTGSQRPLLEEGSDAPGNFQLALRSAASGTGLRLAFGGELLNGMRVSKTHSHADVAFVERQSIQQSPRVEMPVGELRWANNVADIVVTPGLSAALLEAQLLVASAAVLRLYGSGTIGLPLNDIVAKAQRNNPALAAVLLVSACHHGGNEAGRYGASAVAKGIVFNGLDITPEAAVVKAMWLLGDASRRDSLSTLFEENVAGELG